MYSKSRYTKASSRIKRRSYIQNLLQLSLWLGLPVGFLLAAIFIARADFLQIKNVEVLGNVDLSKESIIASALMGTEGSYFGILPMTNYFFIKKEKLTTRLMQDFPELENIEINKNLNGVLKIVVKERQGEFIWCSIGMGDCYLMNKVGLAFSLATKEEINNKIIFKNNLKEVALLSNFSSSVGFQNYLKSIDILTNNKIEVYEIILDSSQKIIFKTNIGEIFLNSEEDFVSTLTNATALIYEIQTKNPSALFEYIDARFGNKVFYKLR